MVDHKKKVGVLRHAMPRPKTASASRSERLDLEGMAHPTGLDPSACYRALTARDPRFDGVFFVGVASTRIYCRPICPAKTPRQTNCTFFSHAAAAERYGFRPCLRCRPELAPGHASVDAIDTLASSAAHAIAAGALNGGSVDTLARSLAVTSRHLHRAVVTHFGVSPIELATTHRLLLAKQLLHETTLPVGQIAFAAGFASLRRFNAAFKSRYRLAPTALRRDAVTTPFTRSANGVQSATSADVVTTSDDMITLTLAYRAPLDWSTTLAWLAARAAPSAEWVGDGRYAATIAVRSSETNGGTRVHYGHIDVTHHARGTIEAQISASLLPVLMPVLAKLRDLFDLDANPDAIAQHLVRVGVAPSVQAFGGVRIPGTLDGFALAIRAIVGQHVSVRGATTVMTRLVERFGERYPSAHPFLTHIVPTADCLANASTADIATLGMPGKRADAIRALAREVASGTLPLTPGGNVAETMRTLVALPGIGDWTAQYIAMRALRWPDAFPANDLILRRAAGNLTAAQLRNRAELWRPWRAYAAMHLWRTGSLASNTSSAT